MIVAEQITHVYPALRNQSERTALDDFSLTVPDGAFCILAGPNGSGKSTLFRLLCGLGAPSRGRVSICGHDLATAPDDARKALGVVFQSPAVDKHLSIAENLDIHGALYGLSRADRRTRATEALDWTRLKDRTHERVDTLSGGLARQVELAKALMTRPRALILDEPTTGLDPAARRAFLDALTRIQKDTGMTVLMTSHIFSDGEAADQVAIMQDGRLLAHDSPDALTARMGREVIVLRSADVVKLTAALAAESLSPRTTGPSELRLEDLDPAETITTVDRILNRHRALVDSLEVRRPSLEDVFVHLTTSGNGKTAADGKRSAA